MPRQFSKLPAEASNSPLPFNIAISDNQLARFRTLLELSEIAAPTYESLRENEAFGVTHKWMSEAKEYWLHKFNWYDLLSYNACKPVGQ